MQSLKERYEKVRVVVIGIVVGDFGRKVWSSNTDHLSRSYRGTGS